MVLILITFGLPTATYGDTANPPKITNVIELSKGSPYKPGDVVSLKVEHTGGNPGIAGYNASWSQICATGVIAQRKFWSEPKLSAGWGLVNEFQGNGVISFIVPNCTPGTITLVKLTIRDETRLEHSVNNSFKFEVADTIFKPVAKGEIAPPALLADGFDFRSIPKNPRPGEIHQLPKYTKTGIPLYYYAQDEPGNGDEICRVRDNFDFVRPGGQIKFGSAGTCALNVISDAGGEYARYGQPDILANTLVIYNPKRRYSARLQFVVGTISGTKSDTNTKNKKISITCKKGKKTKKVKAIKPKCPTGYKVKK